MQLEIPYPPTQGRWVNMAAIEARVLGRQRRNDRRMADRTIRARDLHAGEGRRNRHTATVEGRFTRDDARINLKRRYPSMEE